MATSYVADWKATEVSDVPGVASVDAILYLNSVVQAGAKQWFSYIVGLDVPSTTAGPWAMTDGKDQPDTGEAVVPEVLAKMSNVGLGDVIRITDRDFEIVGLSEGTFSIGNPVFFITKTDLEDIMTSLDILSFILVTAESGVDPKALADTIEREVDKVSAVPAAQFVINDKQMALQMGVETIALMTAIGAALAVLLVAFTIYSHVARQKRELAIAKALGATNTALYLVIAAQAALVTVAAVVFATLLTLLAIPLTSALVPQVTLLLTTKAVARVATIGVLVAVIASLVSARQITRVDPLSAFHA